MLCKTVSRLGWHVRALSSGQYAVSKGMPDLIKAHTVPVRDHMTPEIVLNLITKKCPLWTARPEVTNPFTDPFWAFYWPGGQVLTRYILDNPARFRSKTVLDVGSGCGASAIACKMVGAERVIANDVDRVALTAIQLNAALNSVEVETNGENLIGHMQSNWDIVLLGDMFYDEQFRESLVKWTTILYRKFKTHILIGDPGRLPLVNHPIRDKLTKMAQYDLPVSCREENNGMSTGFVWKLGNG